MNAIETKPRVTEELEAQRLACHFLVRGCEAALADLESAGPTARAGDILREILASWRETLSLLEAAVESGDPARKLTPFTAS
jgi:hypothetical protein